MRNLSVVIALSLAMPSLAYSNSFRDSVARAVEREIAAEAQASAANGKNELLIPGLAVMGGGALVFLYGLVHETGVDCTTNVNASATQVSANCGTTRSKAVIFAGAAIMGAGGYLIWKGDRDRKARPELVPMWGGVFVRQRVRW